VLVYECILVKATRKVGVRVVDWRFSLRVEVLRVSLVAQFFYFLFFKLLVPYATRCVGVLMCSS
jgi:hypothetical protein